MVSTKPYRRIVSTHMYRVVFVKMVSGGSA